MWASRAATTPSSRCWATSRFGDYFKRDAIQFAWELVTSPEWFGIPKDRLYVTIFEGADGVPRDDEAEQFWIETGVPKERIFQYGVKDNFWQMGETGPCGPCSEIFYDMGIEAAETARRRQALRPGRCALRRDLEPCLHAVRPLGHCGAAGKTTGYKLTPLPKPSIDTGMGLERVAAVLQGKVSNFETDLFTPLIERSVDAVNSLHGESVLKSSTSVVKNASLRIIADHARAATFLISDGVLPSNEGRGYVLRKILRRGIRHGRLLGQEEPFLYQMVYAVRDQMKEAYPELADSADRVAKVVEAEEKQFDRVLKLGMSELDDRIHELTNKHVTREGFKARRTHGGGREEVSWGSECGT